MTTGTPDTNVVGADGHKTASGRRIPPYFRKADHVVEPLTKALDACAEDCGEQGRVKILEALRQVVGQAPVCAHILEYRNPGQGPETPENAALHYRVTAEFVRRFSDRHHEGGKSDNAAMLRPGMLLDLWDIWWCAMNPDPYGFEPDFDRSRGHRLVEPALIRDALCRCHPDVRRWLLQGKEDYGDENALLGQIRWQLRHLTRSEVSFGDADRAVLYELMRHFHYLVADTETGQCSDAVKRLIEAGEQFRKSVESKGKTCLPEAPEAAFGDQDRNLPPDVPETERRTIDALQVFFSHGMSRDASFSGLAKHVLEAGKRLGVNPQFNGELVRFDDTFEPFLRRLLLFWAARSRILRYALEDLLDYRFPETKSSPPKPQTVSTGCDCWVALVGHRRRGKTSFMRSLTAALMPDGTKLEGDVDWSKSRVRLLWTDEFKIQDRNHNKVIKESAKKAGRDLNNWLNGEEVQATDKGPSYIAEIDTGHLARLCFFDVAGENMFDKDIGQMSPNTKKLLESRKPVAAVFVDSEYADDRSRPEDGPQYSPVIAGENAPVYVVVNKYDLFRDDYAKDAEKEIEDSLAYTDVPAEHDADYQTKAEAFFSLRQIDFGKDKTPTHRHIVERLDEIPSVARRPHYQQRLRKDIERLDWLFDDLLIAGRRDISLVYLVSASDRRKKPEEFGGIRKLWADIESRVIRSTAKSRREAIKRLLIDTPVKQDMEACRVYGGFEALFKATDFLRDNAEVGRQPAQLSGAWEEFAMELQATMRHVDGGTAEILTPLTDALNDLRSLIAKRCALQASLKKALAAFLPELGIKPDKKLDDLPQLQGAAVDQDLYDRALTAVDEAVRNALKEEDVRIIGDMEEYRTRVGFLLASVIAEDNAEIGAEALNAGVTFNITESGVGLSASVRGGGAARGPSLGYVYFRTLKPSLPNGETVMKWILDNSVDGRMSASNLLLEVLCNVEGTETTRYPNLLLDEGDFDFCRARILSGTEAIGGNVPVLGQRFADFQKNALKLMKKLLEARRDNVNLSDELLENVFMASAIHFIFSSGFGMHLPPIDDLLRSLEGDDEPIERLSEMFEQGEKLRGRLSELVHEWNSPLGVVRLSGKWKEVSSISTEYAGMWPVLDNVSWDSLGAKRMGRVKRGVRPAPPRLKAKLDLLRHLLTAVKKARNIVRGINEKERIMRRLTAAFGANGQGAWRTTKIGTGSLGRVWKWDADLTAQLRRLRIKRQLLIAGYPLLYLRMNEWVERAHEGAHGDEHEKWLRAARNALNLACSNFDEACAEADSAFLPDCPMLHIRQEGERQWIDDLNGNWEALAASLGLDAEDARATIWGDGP